MATKQIISEIPNRDAFFHLLNNNPGLIVLKLGAEWCGPCKQIKHIVHAFFATSPMDVVCGDIDVDQSFDFYSMLKSKKMVRSIPTVLSYEKGNVSYVPNDVVVGSSVDEINIFFKGCFNKATEMLVE